MKSSPVHREVMAFKAIAMSCKVHGGVHTATLLKYTCGDTNHVRLMVETVATGVSGVAEASHGKEAVVTELFEEKVKPAVEKEKEHNDKPLNFHNVVCHGHTDDATELCNMCPCTTCVS